MSTDTHDRHVAESHDDAHDDEESHGSRKGYVIGFLLSVVLTAIPFWMVMTNPLDGQTTALIIMAFAVAQILVHMIYFLHMNRRAEGGWSMMALLFTVVVVVISLSGSLWVMYHMNANMMPAQDMSQMG